MSDPHDPDPTTRNTNSPMAASVGPVYDLAGLRRLTSWTVDEIAARCENHILLRLVTADNVAVFPAFQFDGDQQHPGLSELLRVLLVSGADPWTVAVWLVTGHEELSGTAPMKWLKDESDPQQLLVAANAAAARWAA